MSKRDRGQSCCVLLLKHGQVCKTNAPRAFSDKTILFMLVFGSAEEVTYRWIFNEFPVFLNTDHRRFVSQKTGNLYISKVEAQDAGNYSCFVSSPMIGRSVFSKFIPLIPLVPDEG